MIVFGWGGATPRDHGPTFPWTCPNCHHDGFVHYFTSTKYFRLYWIPVFPYNRRHLLLCPSCTQGFELTPTQAQQARTLSLTCAAFLKDEVGDEAYSREVKLFNRLLISAEEVTPAIRAAISRPDLDVDDPTKAGWYVDPSGSYEYRYWDEQWTEHVTEDGTVRSDPMPTAELTAT